MNSSSSAFCIVCCNAKNVHQHRAVDNGWETITNSVEIDFQMRFFDCIYRRLHSKSLIKPNRANKAKHKMSRNFKSAFFQRNGSSIVIKVIQLNFMSLLCMQKCYWHTNKL